MEVLLKTIHGSYLYNLANLKSDLDYYTVIPTRRGKRKTYAKQTIKDGLDAMVVDFSTFRVYCDMGVPQALEALFSPVADVDYISDFRNNYRVDTASVVGRYRRTIKSFGYSDDFKKRRHALRLCLNLREALQEGRFNPRLNGLDAMIITDMAEDDGYYNILEEMIP